MRTTALALAVLAILAGCGTTGTNTRSSYGNFISSAPASHEKQLADDAARQLLLLYPAASTRLDLRQPSQDGFGKLLVEALRNQGYALQEAPAASPAPSGTTTPVDASTDANATIPFNYLLDSITSPKLYRVTLILGSKTITRAYVPQSEAVHPAGAWVRRE